MNDISTNIKKVLFVFLLCFMALIMYLSYFEIYVAPTIANRPENRRLWAKRNEVLRGTIYDRNGTPLTKSSRIDYETQKREYTGGEVFAHVLGYVDIKYGIVGLERKYDSELMASDNGVTSLFKIQEKGKEKVGNNLVTTLDAELQKKAYDLLGNNRGAVVALNPKTGEILSMVSKPSFNPNNLSEIWSSINKDDNKPLINRATQGLYPPGSTFKTITAISALEHIKDIKNRTFEDNGRLVFNSKESMSNFNGEVLGTLSFKDAYVHSSNVVFGKLAMELGNDNLKETAEKFYFNKDTPADGVTIENSIFPTFKKNEVGNIAQSGIGQSKVLASPMEMALIVSTIANNGTMMKPYIVNAVTNNKGAVIKKIQPESISNVISKDTASTMKDFMRGVVTDGTGVGADIEGLNICGKTGTADHDDKPNVQEPPHSWFIGFAPYENPQIAVAVIVEDGGQGGVAAAKIASQVIRTALKK